MMKYRKKPVVIDAVRWAGQDIFKDGPDWLVQAYETGDIVIADEMHIRTLEGTMKADKGDYVIRGIKGELYPCKPDIFHSSYEPA